MGGSCSWPLNPLLLLVHSLLVVASVPTYKYPVPPGRPGPRSSPRPSSSRYNPVAPVPTYKYPVPPGRPGPRSSPGPSSSRYNPVAPLNTWWVNRDDGPRGVANFSYDDGSVVRPFLVRRSSGRRGSLDRSFACGFFCRAPCNASLFSVFLVVTDNTSSIDSSSGFPQVVWSANRNNPVREGALLNLTPAGQLVLSDSNGTIVWSTAIFGRSVSGMNLTQMGNLVLYSSTGDTVWQSFDHATDTVLLGQSAARQRLVANASANCSKEGNFSLAVGNSSLDAFMVSDLVPQLYYSWEGAIERDQNRGLSQPHYDFVNGMLLPSSRSAGVVGQARPGPAIGFYTDSTYQFVRLEQDGHLRLYEWSEDQIIWNAKSDLLTEWSGSYNGRCIYPTVCGHYAICSTEEGKPEQCSCPTGEEGGYNYFQPVEGRKPDRGCTTSSPPPSCRAGENDLLHQANVSYFGIVHSAANLSGTDVESCKHACLMNCSCKVAFFKLSAGSSKGDCYLPSGVPPLITDQIEFNGGYNSSAFIKVRLAQQPHKLSKIQLASCILGPLLLLGVIGGIVLQRRRRRGRRDEDDAEGYLTHLPGMPTRFSYHELKSATGNFSRKLGEGGFGSVFQGTLADGTMVAVKLLGGKGQGMKEFLAEVETIGSIHHVNLVRLVGCCCARNLHRLLVYEYMCNGSLEKWIFHTNQSPGTLFWRTRHKIILHVAKGLAYLHDDCRHRIAHLDIKPENILLDESFNAKLSDFGLSKLINRDQSQVITTMRGTPGYLAPEWLSSLITEKVDVFSFGVVALETVCGRRNVLHPRPKHNLTLVDEVKSAAQEDRLLDVLDRNCKDIGEYREEAFEMVRVALWCLQGDPNRRPSMSVVVKVLEGVMGIDPLHDFSFSAPTQMADHIEVSSSTPMLASILSGPR